MIRSILNAFRRPQPKVSIDLFYGDHRGPWLLQDCSPDVFVLFLGRPANGGPGEAA